MSLVSQWRTYRHERNARTGLWTLEIFDAQGTLNGEFDVDFENGVEIVDGGNPKDLWPSIQPKSLRVSMRIETGAHHSLVKGIGTSRDVARFHVVLSRRNTVIFAGVILSQGTTFVRSNDIRIGGGTYLNGNFTITAVCGMTLLQKVTFIFGSLQERYPLIYWIDWCISKMPTYQYLRNNLYLFQISWVPDTGSENFVLNQSIPAFVFYDKLRRQGGVDSPNYYQVLQLICEEFNMRCRFAYGYYFFQQIDDLEATSYLYSKGGNYVGTFDVPNYIQDAETDFLNLMDPHVESYEPPIQEARVEYIFGFNSNLAFGEKFNSNVYAESCRNNVSTVYVQTDFTRLRIIGSLEYTPIITGGFVGQARPVFWMKIKVGNNYFARELVVPTDYFHYQYKPEEWTTTVSKYYIIPDLITLPDVDGKKFFFPIFFSTLRMLPQAAFHNEQLTICFGHELYDTNNVKLFESAITVIAILDDLDVTAIDQENNVVEKTSIETVIINPATYNDKKISRQITFSSGPNKSSYNRITDDSDPPVDTINWTVPKQGSGLHYVQLAKSLFARGQQASVWMETSVEGPYQDLVRLRACGAVWLWWTGRYIITESEEYHRGEFLQVGVEPVGFTVETVDKYDVNERPPVPTKGDTGPGAIVEKEVTGITGNRINADTYGIPMPDTTNWSHDQIRSVVTYNKSGDIQRYKPTPIIENEFTWDNNTRDYVLAEKSRAHIWHVFRIHRG